MALLSLERVSTNNDDYELEEENKEGVVFEKRALWKKKRRSKAAKSFSRGVCQMLLHPAR